jgi:hypothetical protein
MYTLPFRKAALVWYTGCAGEPAGDHVPVTVRGDASEGIARSARSGNAISAGSSLRIEFAFRCGVQGDAHSTADPSHSIPLSSRPCQPVN